ncbi:MAG: ribulose phosphate epimerase [Myxococcota bacterium]
MWKFAMFGAVCGLVSAGCVAEPKGDDMTEIADDGGSSTGAFEPAGTTDPDPMAESDDDDGDDDDGGGSFIVDGDDGGIVPSCDVWTQDCPEGEKCSATIEGGGAAWNSTACVPVFDNPSTPGAPCTAESAASGEDDCDFGSMCWGVNEEGIGYCVSLCTGDANSPLCEDPETSCVIVNDGVLNLCLPDCNPLIQDCQADGESCYPSPSGFTCAPDVSEGAGAGEPCGAINTCTGGTFCAGADVLPECDAASCCTEFCDTDLDEMCQAGAECIGLFAEGEAPPGLNTVGGCLLPGS